MMEIDGKTRTCGLIGNPVEHTQSPVIHNTLAQEMGINMTYVPFFGTCTGSVIINSTSR